MASTPPVFKKPKIETWPEEMGSREAGEQDEWGKQEKEILALLEYRTDEVEHLRNRITYYKNQVFNFNFNFFFFGLLFSTYFGC